MTQNIPALLRAHGLSPVKRLGQNFLVDQVALDRIVSAAGLSPHDEVIEVGAGLGTLTRLLAERAARVTAIELDDNLIGILREQLADRPGVRIIHGDVLRMADLTLPHRGYKVVANLPYYITSAVLRRFLEKEPRPKVMVVTVQLEVARRIVAEPGEMSLLSVSVQLYGSPRIVARIPAGAFYPVPKVDSAIVRIEVAPEPMACFEGGASDTALFRVARAGFGQRRKQLRNSLSAGLSLPRATVEAALAEAGIDPSRRAQTLSLSEWAAAASALTEYLTQPGRQPG